METISKFQQRDPLTLRTPRSLEQAECNGMAWWISAEAAAAEEDHIKRMFAEPPKREPTPHVVWAERCIYLIAAGVVVVFFFTRFLK